MCLGQSIFGARFPGSNDASRIVRPFQRSSAPRVRLRISVEVERLFVRLDRITPRFPACQSTLEEFDSEEMHGFSRMQDFSAGLVAGAGTVNHHDSGINALLLRLVDAAERVRLST